MAATAEKLIEEIDQLSPPELKRVAAHCESILSSQNPDGPSQEERIKAVDEFLGLMGKVELPTEEDCQDDPRLAHLLKKHVK